MKVDNASLLSPPSDEDGLFVALWLFLAVATDSCFIAGISALLSGNIIHARFSGVVNADTYSKPI